MSSMQCYKTAKETCQQNCLESCYGHKPGNTTGSYNAGHSMASNQTTALCCQTYYPTLDHSMPKPNMSHSSYGLTFNPNMTKPNMSHSFYGQTYNPNMAKPNMSHNAYGQTYSHHVTDQMTSVTPGVGQAQYGHGHGHAGQQYYAFHGMASCHGKRAMKGDYYKKNKSPSKKKYKDCNRSCGDSSDSDSDAC